jgi:hypothetical protein
MLDTGYWMLDTGCWILDTGCWMLDAAVYAVLRRAKGYWMRVSFTPRRQAAKILSARLCEVFDLLA